MPVWFIRAGIVLGLLSVAGMVVLAVVSRSIEPAEQAPFCVLVVALLVLAEREQRGKPTAPRNPRHRVFAIAAAVAAVVAALLTPWRLDTPWMPVGLFVSLWLAFTAVGYGAAWARARPDAG